MDDYAWELTFGLATTPPPAASPVDDRDQRSDWHRFTATEIARLTIYRAACTARFYNDDAHA